MTTETDLRYALDRIAIQDVIAKYGLGQDLHQPDDADQNILEQWSQVFAPDAVIDASSVGYDSRIDLTTYAEMMRGKGLTGKTGLGAVHSKWQHREGWAVVVLDGDVATATTPFLHLHEMRVDGSQHIHAGTWLDRLERRSEGWRIVHRSIRQGFFQRFAIVPLPDQVL